MNVNIKRAVLLVLSKWSLPAPEDALIAAVQLFVRPSQPTPGDVREELKACQQEGYVEGATDPFTEERTYTLTTKGIHQARKL